MNEYPHTHLGKVIDFLFDGKFQPIQSPAFLRREITSNGNPVQKQKLLSPSTTPRLIRKLLHGRREIPEGFFPAQARRIEGSSKQRSPRVPSLCPRKNCRITRERNGNPPSESSSQTITMMHPSIERRWSDGDGGSARAALSSLNAAVNPH